MFEALFQYQFLQNAVISAILTSIACGIIGTIVIERNLVMMSGGIAHTAFGGVGMGYFLSIEPMVGALLFAVTAAISTVVVKKRTNTNVDVVMGMFWSLGMALGILFIALTPTYPPSLSSYLFGDILTVSRRELWMMGVLNSIIIITVVMLFQSIKGCLFDEEFSYVLGLPVDLLDYIIMILIALTIVLLIRVVGIILIIALLTAPGAIARRLTYNLESMMLYAIGLGMVFSLTGLWLSYQFNVPSGAAIVVVACISYLLTIPICNYRERIPRVDAERTLTRADL